jgi:hypothetical protein
LLRALLAEGENAVDCLERGFYYSNEPMIAFQAKNIGVFGAF